MFHVKHRRGEFPQVFLLWVASLNILSKSMSHFAWFVLNILSNNFAILPQSYSIYLVNTTHFFCDILNILNNNTSCLSPGLLNLLNKNLLGERQTDSIN